MSPSVQLDQVMPAGDGPRYVGAYGGNGSITANFDYIRFVPNAPADATAPVTTHALDPATPGRRACR